MIAEECNIFMHHLVYATYPVGLVLDPLSTLVAIVPVECDGKRGGRYNSLLMQGVQRVAPVPQSVAVVILGNRVLIRARAHTAHEWTMY